MWRRSRRATEPIDVLRRQIAIHRSVSPGQDSDEHLRPRTKRGVSSLRQCRPISIDCQRPTPIVALGVVLSAISECVLTFVRGFDVRKARLASCMMRCDAIKVNVRAVDVGAVW